MNGGDRRKLLILSLILVVAMFGYGMIIPILPFYIESMGVGGGAFGLLIAIGAFTEMVFGPLWGSLSDRVGRKPVLMVGMFGSALALVLMGLSTRFWMLLLSRLLSGVLLAALSSPALAYVGDSSADKDRGGGIGLLGGASEIGITVGPAMGGLLASKNLSTPFFVAAGISGATLLLIFFFLPESLPVEARQAKSSLKQRKGFTGMLEVVRGPVGMLLLLLCLLSFALAGFESVFGLYALKKFSYGPDQVGAILSIVGIVSVVGKTLLAGPATRRWGDENVVKGSALAGGIGYLVLLSAGTYPTILLATGFFILTKTLLRPALFALISRQASFGQGQAMGFSSAFTSLGRIGGSLWAGAIFDVGVDYPYLSGAAIMLAGFFMSLWAISERKTLENGDLGMLDEGML